MSNKNDINVEVAAVTLSIGDGGTTFTIHDAYGPSLCIDSSHFGNNAHRHKMMLTKEALLQLSELFAKAAEYDFQTSEYCYALRASQLAQGVNVGGE